MKEPRMYKQYPLILIVLMMLFSQVLIYLWLRHDSIKFGTIDMQELLLEQSKSLAKTYPTGQVPPKVMQQIVANLKTAISEYGKDHKVTLLSKGAVITDDLPDYTAVFEEQLNESTNHLKN